MKQNTKMQQNKPKLNNIKTKLNNWNKIKHQENDKAQEKRPETKSNILQIIKQNQIKWKQTEKVEHHIIRNKNKQMEQNQPKWSNSKAKLSSWNKMKHNINSKAK